MQELYTINIGAKKNFLNLLSYPNEDILLFIYRDIIIMCIGDMIFIFLKSITIFFYYFLFYVYYRLIPLIIPN